MTERSDYRAETDFRELTRNPRALFGYLFIYFLAVLLLLGVAYVRSLTDVTKNSVPHTIPADTSGLIRDIPFQAPSLLPPVDVLRVGQPSDSLIARGRTLFASSCASCHGETGQGDGPAGAMLQPPPRNFHMATGWTNGPKISDLFRTLDEGIRGTGMASYGFLPPADRFALIHYVRSFVPSAPPPAAQELQQLEATYQLSKGSDIPGQIPVKKAMQLVLRENLDRATLVDRLAHEESPDSAVEGLLRSHCADRARLITAFAATRGDHATAGAFQRAVMANTGGLGLRASVAQMSPREWATLHQYVAGIRSRIQR